MRKRHLFALGVAALAVLVTLVVWQGSFSLGEYGPSSIEQVYLFWAMSTLIFLLTVTLGFMLFRTGVKLYIERQTNREGSRIKSKLVIGALALSFMPVFFLVLFSVQVLNLNLDKWFSRPAQNIRLNLIEVGQALDREAQERTEAQARWLAGLPEVRNFSADARVKLAELCRSSRIDQVSIERTGGASVTLCGPDSPAGLELVARAGGLPDGGELVVRNQTPVDTAARQRELRNWVSEYDQLATRKKDIRALYILLLLLISLFILFVATWIALILARQISVPISALLGAAREIRTGNLRYRVEVPAIDELATLVRAFNEMTHGLEANDHELERRRRFTEAILESIPTGVISLSSDGRIQKVNRALRNIFPEAKVAQASWLEDLFSREDCAEIRYLMKRARRTGQASRQLDLERERQTMHVSVTLSALDEKVSSGFVLVLEDTSELLRAQKAAAWHEVARRIAHEMKNPLTPISLCAERIARQIERLTLPAEARRILGECSTTISQEVESVRTLVDEFSRFARFPAAQRAPADLNEVIESALLVFAGRLDGIQVYKQLSPGLPQVNIDREQFKRVVVNLVDNAAEAMQESPLKRLLIATQPGSAESVDLVIADTGCGISPEDREKLFLPYFSTKGRGTGLGLAIVHHILAEHEAQIRVEDNQPAGVRFLVEIPAIAASETEATVTVQSST